MVSLSVVVLHETDIRTVDYFRNKNAVIALVQDLIPNVDNELVEDIADFLSHIAKDLSRNFPAEVTENLDMEK